MAAFPDVDCRVRFVLCGIGFKDECAFKMIGVKSILLDLGPVVGEARDRANRTPPRTVEHFRVGGAAAREGDRSTRHSPADDAG